MKKKLLLLSLTLLLGCISFAASSAINGQYKTKPIVKVTLDGREINPEGVPGYLDGGTTMVPLGLLRKVGFFIDWDQSTLTANISTKPPEEPKTPLTLEQIKGLSNAVAIVYALDDNGNRWRQGSGFLINTRGLLITAYHVADEEGKLRALEVEVNGKTYRVPAGVCVFADGQKDIFGVYLQDPNPLPYLKVNDRLPKINDDVYVMGNPEGQRNVVNKGDITAVFKEDGKQYVNGMYEAKPGNSGGPLVDEYGYVVGIVTNPMVSTSILEAKVLYEQTF